MIMMISLLIISCKKDPVSPAPLQEKKVLLKDIIIPHLPSPFYHFDYRADSMVAQVSFAAGLTTYDVVYNGSKVTGMRTVGVGSQDTLRYIFDNTGKVGAIVFINNAGITMRHAFITYQGQKISEIEWDHKEGNAGYLIDRKLNFTYYADGNVREIREHRPAFGGQEELNYVTLYEEYDDKRNVDDFMLLHDGFHDHLFLLSGTRTQLNNPRRETRSGNGVNYTVNYTYIYKADGTPLSKAGNLLFTSGPQTGQTFQTTVTYDYY